VLGTAAVYGLLQNGCWVAGGADDSYYLSVAVNLLNGKGYVWNGAPVLLVTPGWPALLAAAMKVSPTFAFLNLLSLGFMTAAAVAWYRVLHRLTTPWRAFSIVAACVLLFEWHRQSCSLFSDSPYILLLGVGVLLALQIRNGRPLAWRLPLLALACVAIVLVRYAGTLTLPLLVGALLAGSLRPRLNRQWLSVLVVIVAVGGTFLVLRSELRDNALQKQRTATTSTEQTEIATAMNYDERREGAVLSLMPRFSGGSWVTELLWPPAVSLESRTILMGFVHGIGWLLLLIFSVTVWKAVRRRDWLWAGAALSIFVLISRPQSHSVPRYLAPLAPLLVLGLWNGVENLVPTSRPAWMRKFAAAALAILLGSAALTNAAILGTSAWAVRSGQFHKLWLAGEYDEVLRLGAYLGNRNIQDGELAVGAWYDDPQRKGGPRWIQRAMCLLTGRTVKTMPMELASAPPGDALAQWARKEHVRFVVVRPETPVRRIWHLRLSPGPGPEDPSATAYYVLYEVREDGLSKVDLPEVSGGLRTVPGLEAQPPAGGA
jgi:hypothetical protein